MFDYLDGELIIGNWDDGVEYNDNQSAIMSRDGKPDFTFCVFDHIEYAGYTFRWRNNHALKVVEHIQGYDFPFVVHFLEQRLCHNVEELLEYEADIVARGFEGIIVRDSGCRYKNNRATWREQGMFKMKRFMDAEGEIIGYEELLINDNKPELDALGYQKRSDHNAGKIPGGTLGKLVVKILTGPFAGEITNVGSGLDDQLRGIIWNNRQKFLGKVIKFKYQSVGSKNLPRTPIFLSFLHKDLLPL